jgi:malonyl-CoA O-methyltransferase
MVAKEVVKRNFSRYAAYYDEYCAVQNHCGRVLIAKAGVENFTKILDIGCGTGNYTKLLRARFGSAVIKAVDISAEMVAAAQGKLAGRGIDFIAADAETVRFGEKFGLISSNACFQWFENLEKSLVGYKNMLDENGIILFSVFGPATLYELAEVMGEPLSCGSFARAETIKKMLEKYFTDVTVTEEILEKNYESLWELLRTIKYTGTGGANGRILSRGQIKLLEQVYKEKFGGITATYQVFYCRAKRKDRAS